MSRFKKRYPSSLPSGFVLVEVSASDWVALGQLTAALGVGRGRVVALAVRLLLRVCRADQQARCLVRWLAERDCWCRGG